MHRRSTRPQKQVPEQQVPVRGEFITLGQLLKVAGVIGNGGEAKFYLADVTPVINGEPDARRGRKLRPGDLVLVPGEAPIRLVAQCEDPDGENDLDI